jgi:hypothetical protein
MASAFSRLSSKIPCKALQTPLSRFHQKEHDCFSWLEPAGSPAGRTYKTSSAASMAFSFNHFILSHRLPKAAKNGPMVSPCLPPKKRFTSPHVCVEYQNSPSAFACLRLCRSRHIKPRPPPLDFLPSSNTLVLIYHFLLYHFLVYHFPKWSSERIDGVCLSSKKLVTSFHVCVCVWSTKTRSLLLHGSVSGSLLRE